MCYDTVGRIIVSLSAADDLESVASEKKHLATFYDKIPITGIGIGTDMVPIYH